MGPSARYSIRMPFHISSIPGLWRCSLWCPAFPPGCTWKATPGRNTWVPGPGSCWFPPPLASSSSSGSRAMSAWAFPAVSLTVSPFLSGTSFSLPAAPAFCGSSSFAGSIPRRFSWCEKLRKTGCTPSVGNSRPGPLFCWSFPCGALPKF